MPGFRGFHQTAAREGFHPLHDLEVEPLLPFDLLFVPLPES